LKLLEADFLIGSGNLTVQTPPPPRFAHLGRDLIAQERPGFAAQDRLSPCFSGGEVRTYPPLRQVWPTHGG
jgi:hypothetical protein